MMRGLETRVQLAHARVLAVTDASKAIVLVAQAEAMAENDGWQDAEQGVQTMPAMFDDELILASKWCDGQRRNRLGFDDVAWLVRCEQMATSAGNSCGLSYDLYVNRLSHEVDLAVGRMPERHRAEALAIAVSFGYVTPQQCAEDDDWNACHGYCQHGIEMGCCPAGCDFPDEEDVDSDGVAPCEGEL